MRQENNARLMNFMFRIGNDSLAYSCPSGVLGGINLGITEASYKSHDFPTPSNKITYDDLIVPFYLSEDMHEWIEIVKWLFFCKNNNDIYPDDKLFKECTMMTLDGQDNIKMKVVYHDCFPYNIETVNYSVNVDKNEPVVFNVGFKYTHMTIETPNGEKFNEFED